ncbi:MAG: proteasome assembly chaperone family protein [Candidatus Heimdallarchaeaceae archaeon]
MKTEEQFGDTKFIFVEQQDFTDCTLIVGWHGLGECGFLSVNHLVEKLNAKRIGLILTKNIPQYITIRKQAISYPLELYRSDNIILLLPLFEPNKSDHISLAKGIVDWSIENRFKQALLIGGLDKRLKQNDELKVVYTHAYKKLNENIEYPFLDDSLLVAGLLAYLLMFYELKEFPAFALLPYTERSRADPIAASIAVKHINQLLSLNVDIQDLLEQAEKIEKEIQSFIEASRKAYKETDDDRSMFV